MSNLSHTNKIDEPKNSDPDKTVQDLIDLETNKIGRAGVNIWVALAAMIYVFSLFIEDIYKLKAYGDLTADFANVLSHGLLGICFLFEGNLGLFTTKSIRPRKLRVLFSQQALRNGPLPFCYILLVPIVTSWYLIGPSISAVLLSIVLILMMLFWITAKAIEYFSNTLPSFVTLALVDEHEKKHRPVYYVFYFGILSVVGLVFLYELYLAAQSLFTATDPDSVRTAIEGVGIYCLGSILLNRHAHLKLINSLDEIQTKLLLNEIDQSVAIAKAEKLYLGEPASQYLERKWKDCDLVLQNYRSLISSNSSTQLSERKFNELSEIVSKVITEILKIKPETYKDSKLIAAFQERELDIAKEKCQQIADELARTSSKLPAEFYQKLLDSGLQQVGRFTGSFKTIFDKS